MSSDNRTVFEMYASVLPINYTYGVLGILAMACNLFVLLVYVSRDVLRKHFVLFSFISVADSVNGLAFLETSITRITKVYALIDATLDNYPMTYRYQCASEFNNALMLIGSQWPALLTLVLGIERFIAVKFPVHYYKMPNYYLAISLATLLIVVVSMGIALFIGFVVAPNKMTEYLCTMTSAYGWEYSTFHYLFTAFGHTFGFLLNLAALFLAIRSFSKAGMQKLNFHKELSKIKLTFLISFFSVIFVVVPNIILYIARWVDFQYEAMGWLYCAFLLRSCFNVYVIGFANSEFRGRVFEIIRMICMKLITSEVNTMRNMNVMDVKKVESLQKQQQTITVAHDQKVTHTF